MNKALGPDLGAQIRTDFVPAQDYVGPHVAALEKARLWPKVWQNACREEEIPNVGDFVNYELFDESILIVRTAKDAISAFYNVCQHRGRRLRDEERGNVAQGFYCRFHGWRYALNGKITHIYHEEDWKNCAGFKKSDLNLKQPKVGTWAGWVWINMDPDAEPLVKWLDAIVPRLKNLEMDKMRMAWYETLIAPVNWKVVVEAFNEGYHSGATHNHWIDYKLMDSPGHVHGRNTMYFTAFSNGLPSAKRESGHWKASTSIQDWLYYQSLEIYRTLFALVMDPQMNAITRVKNETKPTDPPEQIFGKLWEWHKEEMKKAGLRWPSKLTQEEFANAGTGWHIFPNTVMLPAVDGVLWYRMRPHPQDEDKCIFDIWCLRPYEPGREPKVKRNITVGFEAFRGKNGFLEQDFDNMEATNKGMKSRGWRGAECSPRQEVQVSHFHKVLRTFLYGTGESLTAEPPAKKAASAKAKSKPKSKARKKAR
jgi:phenylpropionate dioxygenase-like ring-hydroxylating dioxygenase large terminal subunit